MYKFFQALFFIPIAIVGLSAWADHGTGSGQSFTFLEAGFTQDIFGVKGGFMGGVSFASDGDAYVNDCVFGGGSLHRFDAQGTLGPINATNLHPFTTVPSNAGCGMANHQDGFIYSNTGLGVTQIDPATGAATGYVFGNPGNALGIAPDPQTGDAVYVGSDCAFSGTCTIYTSDPDDGSTSVFVTLPGLLFIDGIYFNPDGSELWMATRSPVFAATVVDRDGPGLRTGTLNRHIPLPSEPDGIAFHTNGFVVTANLDGTLSRVDPGPDTVSLFGSGGFRGDLTQVGVDECLYITQDGTRYDNGVVSGENSLVRICPGFVPPPGVVVDPFEVQIDVKPDSDVNPINPSSRGVIPVAILGTEAFDVADVDPTTLAFGPSAVGLAHKSGPHVEDVNMDGLADLLGHFRTQETGIERGSTEACMSGELFDGTPFEACDSIRTVGGGA